MLLLEVPGTLGARRAVDAMAGMDPVAHANTIARIFPALGETGATDDVISLLGASR